MKKKFGYMLTGAFTFLLSALLTVCAGSILYSIFRIAGIFDLVSHNAVLDGLAAALSATFATLLIFILTARYIVDDGCLKLKLGFWDMTGGKFKIENMIKVVKAVNDDKLYVNLYVDGAPQIALINIRLRNFNALTDALKAVNPRILYEEADVN